MCGRNPCPETVTDRFSEGVARMPRPSKKVPAYRHHKSDGRALVTIGGRDIYLGRWNSPESRDEYDRVIAEWLASGRGRSRTEAAHATGEPVTDPTVSEILVAFWKHAEQHYRDVDGKPTQEIVNVKDSIKPVKRLYGKTSARSFGPLALRAVRDAMVRAGLARSTINDRINRVRRVFKWAASMELVPGSVAESLRTVDGLREGRTNPHEAPPIHPVAIEHIEATLP
jgi:hypothetical protein